MIAGAAAAQMVKQRMEAGTAGPAADRAATQPEPDRRPGRVRIALAAALRAGADQLAPRDERWRGSASAAR